MQVPREDHRSIQNENLAKEKVDCIALPMPVEVLRARLVAGSHDTCPTSPDALPHAYVDREDMRRVRPRNPNNIAER